MVGEIERIVEENLRGTGLTAQFYGAHVMQLEIRNAVERDRADRTGADAPTIVLACGLAVAMFSDLPSLRLFRWLAAITLIAALIGYLMILPSVMLLIHRMRRPRSRTADQNASGP